MPRRTLWCALAALLLPCAAAAQDTLQTREGSVEIIGLHRWTRAMVRDSVEKATKRPLFSSACAVVLERQYHFAAAAVTFLQDAPDAPVRLRIRVVEPQDSARVRFAAAPAGPAIPLPAWDSVLAGFRHGAQAEFYPGEFLTAVQLHPEVYGGRPEMALARVPGPQQDAARALWSALESHRSAADGDVALRVLRSDPDTLHRTLAAALLVNFRARPQAWLALMEALRDPDPYVRDAAQTALSQMLQGGTPPRVDWAPAAASLRYLIGGTNLWAYSEVLAALEATQIEPALAAPLLAGNDELLLAHLRALDPMSRTAARRLLVRLAGRDLGSEPAAWAQWLRGLRAAAPTE